MAQAPRTIMLSFHAVVGDRAVARAHSSAVSPCAVGDAPTKSGILALQDIAWQAKLEARGCEHAQGRPQVLKIAFLMASLYWPTPYSRAACVQSTQMWSQGRWQSMHTHAGVECRSRH